MMNKRAQIILLLLFSLISCEREAKNIILPEFRQKLVVTSFISPSDSVLSVSVSMNSRIYGDLNKVEDPGNLRAYLSHGDREFELVKDVEGFKLSAEEMQVMPGQRYDLRITSDKGLNAEAFCTVPVKRDFSPQADTSKRVYYDPYQGSMNLLVTRVFLADFPAEDNYYRFGCKMILYDPESYYYPYILRISGTASDFADDKGKDGERFMANSYLIPYPKYIDSAFLVFYYLNTDKAYYDYHKSLMKYKDGDNPFTEPSPLFSNITGGLGIFASYTMDSLILRLR
jgi:hypothetical protein